MLHFCKGIIIILFLFPFAKIVGEGSPAIAALSLAGRLSGGCSRALKGSTLLRMRKRKDLLHNSNTSMCRESFWFYRSSLSLFLPKYDNMKLSQVLCYPSPNEKYPYSFLCTVYVGKSIEPVTSYLHPYNGHNFAVTPQNSHSHY